MLKRSTRGLFSTVLSGFFRGVLILGPMGFTVYVLYATVSYLDSLVPLTVPGAGIVLAFGIITLVGFLASNVLGRTLVEWIERGIERVPIVKLLYGAIRDLLGAFIDNRKRFSRPVMVELSPSTTQAPSTARAGEQATADATAVHMLGFVTRDDLPEAFESEQVAVYIPQCYNLGGNLLIVPRNRITPLDTDAAQTMTFIVSGGLSGLRKGQSIPPPP